MIWNIWICKFLRLYIGIEYGTYMPPILPPTYAKPFASARYFSGKTSEGMAWTTDTVHSVVPISTPPPIKTDIEEAVAETTAPTKAINGGMAARYFLSNTSESRPTIGERTLWMRRGPWRCYCHHLCFVIKPLKARFIQGRDLLGGNMIPFHSKGK